jgi:Fe-S-cluster-containing hydrogenase component 2
LRVCHTEAIRIRKGKAQAMVHRCVYCGRCIQVCPQKAWKASSSASEDVPTGEKAMAILDPAVFWQFGDRVSPEDVIQAFQEIGFPLVQNMSEPLATYGTQVTDYLSSPQRPLPAISSTCPAVVEFIRVKYPSLIENLVPILPPIELLISQMGETQKGLLPAKEVYVTPCLAQAEAIRSLLGEKAMGGEFLPIEKVYNRVKRVLHRRREETAIPQVSEVFFRGMKWATPGGESEALGVSLPFIAAGLERLASILERVGNGVAGRCALY